MSGGLIQVMVDTWKKQIITAVELENIHFAAYISQLMHSKQKNKTKINPLNFFFFFSRSGVDRKLCQLRLAAS